jgi:hypothetical protein
MYDRPEWLIDDTAQIGEARIFAVHTASPRFIGEVIPDRELGTDEFREDLVGITFGVHGWTLCRIEWIDPPNVDTNAICRSLAEAMDRHDAVRQSLPEDDG